jgi:hypothetical protein
VLKFDIIFSEFGKAKKIEAADCKGVYCRIHIDEIAEGLIERCCFIGKAI